MIDESPPSFRRSLARLNALFTPRDRRTFAALAALAMAESALETIGIGAIPAFLAILIEPESLARSAGGRRIAALIDPGDPVRLAAVGCAALFAIYLAKNAMLVLGAWLRSRFVFGRYSALSPRLMRAYLAAPCEFHLERNSAELRRNAHQECEIVCLDALGALLDLICYLPIGLGVLGLLFWLEPRMSLLVLGLLGLAGGGYLWWADSRSLAFAKQSQAARAGLIRAFGEGLEGYKESKIAAREDYYAGQFARHLQAYSRASLAQTLASSSIGPFLETVAAAAMAALALAGSERSLVGAIPVIALFGVALVRLKSVVARIVAGFNDLRYALVAVDPVFEDLARLEAAATEDSRNEDEDAPRFDSRIVLRGVSYRYPNASGEAIVDASLEIEIGQSVAFVGATGSGKTTLADLIVGLLDPNRGAIEVDGRDIRRFRRQWQAQIGYVPQAIFLSDDTIRRNVALGIPDAEIDGERVCEALETAQLAAFARSLPRGLDSPIGERGARISGGERQRLGIARALYRRPRLLVLDEGTASLDSATQQALIRAIASRQGECAAILIAHRFSSIRHCDRIFFLEKGRIADSGTYDELMRRNARFRVLAAEQPGDSPPPQPPG